MSNFRNFDRDTGFLLPPSVNDWLPERHLARFVAEIVDALDVSAMSNSYRGSGSASYRPKLLLAVLVYGYATGEQIGAGDIRLGGLPLHRGERAPRSRHHRHK
jgi:hypothetical protein